MLRVGLVSIRLVRKRVVRIVIRVRVLRNVVVRKGPPRHLLWGDCGHENILVPRSGSVDNKVVLTTLSLILKI